MPPGLAFSSAHDASQPHVSATIGGQTPSYIGYTDACKYGAGGLWCSGTVTLALFLWSIQWPREIQDKLVTADNLCGKITKNDLELTGALLGLLALEAWSVCLLFVHLAWLGKNMTSIAWDYLLCTSKSHIAEYILRFIWLQLHHLRTSNLVPHHLSEDDNIMADIISRLFKKGGYFNKLFPNIVEYFDHHFPLQSGS